MQSKKVVAVILAGGIIGAGIAGMPYEVAAQTTSPTCPTACANGLTCEWANSAHTQTECTTVVSGVDVQAVRKSTTATGGLAGIVSKIVHIANTAVIPLLYALAFLFFLFGIVRFFFIEGGEEGQEKGKKFLLYGLIGLVVLFAVWGILNLLLATLNSVAG